MWCFILINLGDQKMAYEMKVQVTVTKDGQAFAYNENTNSNLDYPQLVMLQGILFESQVKLRNIADDLVKKGKK